MKINKFNYQIELLEKIKAKIQHAFSYADEIADLLQISKDAVYRRMRGESALSLDEAAILIAHYQIENPFQINNSMVNFHFNISIKEEKGVNVVVWGCYLKPVVHWSNRSAFLFFEIPK